MSFEPIKREDAGLIPAATLVIWLACVTVGVLGYLLPHQRPKSPTTQPEPTDAEVVDVSLTEEPVTPPDQLLKPQAALAEPARQVPSIPDLPVAAASPSIAFALPVKAPVHVAEPHPAAAVNSLVPVQVFVGEGDGNQPKPDYPEEADRTGQQGTIRVDFIVTDEGRITSARITQPCEWPLLNQAALRCIRDRWSFSPKMKGPHFVMVDYRQ